MSKKVNKGRLIKELRDLQDILLSQVYELQRCIKDCENADMETVDDILNCSTADTSNCTIEDILNCSTATDNFYWDMRYFEYENSKIAERFGVLKDAIELLKMYDKDADMSSILDREKSTILGVATINMAENILDDKILTKQENTKES